MVSFFVPALNEEKNIENTVNDIRYAAKHAKLKNFEIIIYNDGSTDNTQKIVTELEKKHPFVNSIHNKENCGLGHGFRETLKIAKFPKFFFIAGDNDMSRDVIGSLLINRHKADLVLIYFLNKEIRGRRRNLLSTFYNVIYMVTYGIFVQYINGGVLYSTEKLKKFNLKSNRFSIIIEATIKLLKSGASFYEVGGYMQRGLEGSSSFSLKNLIEVMFSYFRLAYEIKIKNRKFYNKSQERIY